MKKELILIPILAFVILFAVAPAMAAPATKVPAMATATLSNLPGSTYVVTDGGVLQVRGIESVGTVNLYIASSPPANPNYVLSLSREGFGTVNLGTDIAFPGPWPEARGVWHSDVIWTYEVNGQVLGTFKGEWTLKTIGWYTSPGPHNGPSGGHIVLQGDGIFDDLILSLDSTGPPSVFTGYLLMH